ncbi:GNAT family N-acetyltransferase [Sutcliffiella rhizosphaerae]|uniref:GNAT family N-acetyltransferase n=1 Tax=Sutcliffiella rhizosphaerae TaxID=2880967 RepID=UPI001E404637|nr:GNAT family N-acetyltransferase [Sutcliffiella rhizosphaerae]
MAKPGDKIVIANWKTTYKGIIEDRYLQTISVVRRQKMWKEAIEEGYETKCLYVVERDRVIIGFATGGSERTNNYRIDDELFAIYILEEFQGQGIGIKLFEKVATFLSKKGYNSILVWVLKDNPSYKFYESFQPTLVGTEQIEIGGKSYEEVAYGWKDIRCLLHVIQMKRADN